MKVLVTGATGFIGSALVRALTARGERVTVLARQPGSAADLPAGTERLQWSADVAPPRAAFDGVDAVVHLAGESITPPWSQVRKQKILRSRVDGTRAVVDGLVAATGRSRVLVAASAVGIYGDRGDEVLTEASPPGTGFLADVCRAWEAEAARAADAGVRVVHLRIGVVLDAGGGALRPLAPMFKLALGGRIGSGRQWMSWVHRHDVVGLVLHALGDSELTGVMNATAPEPATNAEFTHALATALHRPAVIPVPAAALRLVLGDAAEMLLASERVLPQRALASGYVFRHPALVPALQAIVAR